MTFSLISGGGGSPLIALGLVLLWSTPARAQDIDAHISVDTTCTEGAPQPIDSVATSGGVDSQAVTRALAKYVRLTRSPTRASVADVVTFYRGRRRWLYVSFVNIGSSYAVRGNRVWCRGGTPLGFEYDVAADSVTQLKP